MSFSLAIARALSEIRSAEAGRASVRWAKTGQVRAHDVMKQGGSPQRRAAELGRAETALREAADLAAFARKPNLEPAPDKMELAQLSAKGLIDWPQPRDWIFRIMNDTRPRPAALKSLPGAASLYSCQACPRAKEVFC